MDLEIWKDIEYADVRPDMYEVSAYGRVRNKNTGQILHQYVDRHGYMMTFLSIINREKGKQFKIHRLVATAFIPNPENKPEVNHIDGVKSNNFMCNLEWCTSSENQKHAYKLGLQKSYKGEKHSSAKFNDDIINHICKLLMDHNGDLNAVYKSIKLINDDMSKDIIKSIKYKQNWSHISDKYFYNGQFRKCLTEDQVRLICKLLLKYEGNIRKVKSDISDQLPDIPYRTIQGIRLKKSWARISDEYFNKERFFHQK